MAYKTSANLFEVGDFISHAGNKLAWKIECDAMRPEWWDGVARMIMDYQTEPFREFCTDKQTMFAYKWCIFARKPIIGNKSHDVRSLFTMPAK